MLQFLESYGIRAEEHEIILLTFMTWWSGTAQYAAERGWMRKPWYSKLIDYIWYLTLSRHNLILSSMPGIIAWGRLATAWGNGFWRGFVYRQSLITLRVYAGSFRMLLLPSYYLLGAFSLLRTSIGCRYSTIDVARATTMFVSVSKCIIARAKAGIMKEYSCWAALQWLWDSEEGRQKLRSLDQNRDQE